MKLFLPFFVVFIVWLSYELKKSTIQREKTHEEFLAREQQANLTRRQNIDSLDYITIPLKSLPFLENSSEKISASQDAVKKLASKRIINLSSISNTELKFQYGAANLDVLSSYDENFTFLITALNTWANALLLEDYTKEAITVLEYAISIGADTKRTYVMLAKEYAKNNEFQKIQSLIKKANSLSTLTKNSIVSELKQIYNSQTESCQ